MLVIRESRFFDCTLKSYVLGPWPNMTTDKEC